MKKQVCYWDQNNMFSLYAESVKDEYTPFWSNHENIEFMLPFYGHYSLLIGDKSYQISPGKVVFIDENQLHKVMPESQEEFLIVSFVVDWASFSKFLNSHKLNFDLALMRKSLHGSNLITVDSNFAEELQVAAHNLYYEIEESKNANSAMINALLLQIFVLLYRNLQIAAGIPSDEEKTFVVSDIVSDVIDFINENYNQQISLCNIAQQFWINPSQLSRAFKKETGANITDFIRSMRMYYAKELLVKTTKTISEIGFDVGYNNTAYFNTLFLRETDMSPKQFRQVNGNR